MYIRGAHNPEHIVKKTNAYKLKGKADVVFQNEGTNNAIVGVRVVKPNTSYRMSGEHTILNNSPVNIVFEGAGTNSLWVHFIEPELDDCKT